MIVAKDIRTANSIIWNSISCMGQKVTSHFCIAYQWHSEKTKKDDQSLTFHQKGWTLKCNSCWKSLMLNIIIMSLFSVFILCICSFIYKWNTTWKLTLYMTIARNFYHILFLFSLFFFSLKCHNFLRFCKEFKNQKVPSNIFVHSSSIFLDSWKQKNKRQKAIPNGPQGSGWEFRKGKERKDCWGQKGLKKKRNLFFSSWSEV